MSQLVKTKRQANFKGFKRFGAFKELVEQKNVVFNSFVRKLTVVENSSLFDEFVCKLGLFTRVLKWPTRAKKGPIYTQTRQINYYFLQPSKKRDIYASLSSRKVCHFLIDQK
jgi:hypothetical protein